VSLRWAVERASHRFVVRRRLPPPFASARIYVSTEGGLRYLVRTMAEVDPMLLQLAAEVVRPGDTVWDVGANMGLFTFAAAVAAGPAGHVLAVEPDTEQAGLLRRSAAEGAVRAPVEVLPVAVSDELSVARFHVARRNRATSHLAGFGSAMAGGVRSTHLVPTVTLDWLAARFPAPDVLKVDVEGAELAVLSGGAGVLARAHTVICEVCGENTDAVTGILASHGYTLYDGERRGHREPVAAAPFNTLAVVARGLVREPLRSWACEDIGAEPGIRDRDEMTLRVRAVELVTVACEQLGDGLAIGA
jgi:FkbM family methyltransferase